MSWRADDDDVLEGRESTGAPGSGSYFPSNTTMLVSRMERPAASRERCCYLASHESKGKRRRRCGWRNDKMTKAKSNQIETRRGDLSTIYATFSALNWWEVSRNPLFFEGWADFCPVFALRSSSSSSCL